MIDIVFLTYVHRSGSTYFASLLNNCKELGVSLSSGSLGRIIDAKQLPIRTEADAAVIFENYLRILNSGSGRSAKSI